MNNLSKRVRLLQFFSYGVLILTMLLAVWAYSINFANSVVSSYNIWTLPLTSSGFSIFTVVIRFVFFFMLLVLLLPIFTIAKKKNVFLYITYIALIAYNAFLLIYQFSTSNALGFGSIILIVINLVVLLAMMSALFIVSSLDKEKNKANKISKPIDAKISKKYEITTLLFDIFGLLLLVAMFFIPLLVTNEGVASILINAFANNDILIYVLFLSTLGIVIAAFFVFLNVLSKFFYNRLSFMKSSRVLNYIYFFILLAFFITGFILTFINNNSGVPCYTYSYALVGVMGIIIIALSFIYGKYLSYQEDIASPEKEKKVRHYFQIEPLIYVTLTVLVSVGMLFLTLIRVRFTSEAYNSIISFTGFDLLAKYGQLGVGYQALAFGVISMLIINGLGLLITITTYFTHYKHFARIVKSVVLINVFLVFLFGMSGLYFAIAQEINKENINSLISSYLGSVPEYSYTIETDAIYALGADVVVVAIMFIRKAFERSFDDETPEIKVSGEIKSTPDEDSVIGNKAGVQDGEEEIKNFDPCQAFSQIDEHAEELLNMDKEKSKVAAKNPSLHQLVNFVVDYAKNSRLHLSYSKQDIATFVAGLGVSRLAILQGMSGTGKTSLPKIFMEAICGECLIVEVESSWKDKNELLGYYNDFSSTFTPKKFTTFLYKAYLEKNVPTFIVLDELNLSRIEYYFSDFLSLMENEEDKRSLKLINSLLYKKVDGKDVYYRALADGHDIVVSNNIWFIGTANRDDSTFVISDKVYDRANTMNFMKRAPKIKEFEDPISPTYYSNSVLQNLFKEAKVNQSFDVENNIYVQNVEKLLKPYNISFGNRILNQMEDFVKIYKACFPRMDVEKEAIEIILLSKVVAKLEVKAVENKDELVEAFTSMGLLRIADFVAKLDEE